MRRNGKDRQNKFKGEGIENPKETFGKKDFTPKNKQPKRRGSGNGGAGRVDPHYAGTNDINWYVSNEQLLQDVGRFSFNIPAGADIPLAIAGNNGFANDGATDLVERLPGIMTIECVPMYGISDNQSSALNMASQLLYNLVRVENSGARNYDAPDLMHYVIGVDNLFIFYAMMLRLYGTLNNFTFLNRYTPEALVYAMGFDYNSLAGNMAQFRSYINNYAKKLSTYVMPHNLTIVERHFNMFGRVYKDSESPKAQYYMYVPAYIWQYNPIGSQTGAAMLPMGMLKSGVAFRSSSPGWTFDELKLMGDQLMAAMNDEDMFTMAGDLLKAFGEDKIWKQDYIDATYSLDPVFDFTWLTQIQNANSWGRVAYTSTAGNTTLDTGITIEQVIPSNGRSPWLRSSVARGPLTDMHLAYDKLLVSPYDTPSPGDVMESSRLLLGVRNTHSDAGWRAEILSCGAEIVVGISIYAYMYRSSVGLDLHKTRLETEVINGTDTTTTVTAAYWDFARLDCFAMHPTVYHITKNGTAGNLGDYSIEAPIADIDNWTVLSNSDIKGLHDVALLSMLYVRNVGLVARY